jgi:CheY-like chemotaxis protein
MSEVVLIVDDDPVQRRLLEAMVQRFGYQALVADGGDAALTLLTGPDPARVDCLILDLVMPDLDGLGVLARMRDAGLNIRDRADGPWRNRQRRVCHACWRH